MKKIIFSLLIVVLMTVMLAPTVFAAGTSVVVSDVTATPGTEVTLNVSVSGNTGFGAATFDIIYDEDVLTLTAIGVDGTLFGKGSGVQNVAKNRVNCASAVAITGDGVLFTLTFKVADSAVSGEYAVSVAVKNFADSKGATIATTVVAGTVKVHKCEGTLVPANDATCTETGNIAYYMCDCGKLYSDEACTNEITESDTVVGVVDHTWTWVTDKEATCGEAGEKHEECDCGAKRNEGTKIPATGNHTWEWVTDKEATCGEAGEKHEECDCGAKRNEGTKIPATGNHTWEWVTDKEATCGEAGEKHEECDCGAKRNEGTKIPATGDHTWEWVIDKEATVTEEGEKHEECDCGAKRNEGTKIPVIEVIPPTGDSTFKCMILAFVALVVLTGTCYITKKQENI